MSHIHLYTHSLFIKIDLSKNTQPIWIFIRVFPPHTCFGTKQASLQSLLIGHSWLLPSRHPGGHFHTWVSVCTEVFSTMSRPRKVLRCLHRSSSVQRNFRKSPCWTRGDRRNCADQRGVSLQESWLVHVLVESLGNAELGELWAEAAPSDLLIYYFSLVPFWSAEYLKILGGLPYRSPATVPLRSKERSCLCLTETETPGWSLSSEGWSSSPAAWSSSCGAGWSGCSHRRGEVERWRSGVPWTWSCPSSGGNRTNLHLAETTKTSYYCRKKKDKGRKKRKKSHVSAGPDLTLIPGLTNINKAITSMERATERVVCW